MEKQPSSDLLLVYGQKDMKLQLEPNGDLKFNIFVPIFGSIFSQK